MGLYYQPPLTYIGAAQPLTPKELTPSPAPSNPVLGAVSLAATLVAAWSAVATPLPQRAPPVAAIVPAPVAQLPLPSPSQPYTWPQPDWLQPPRGFLAQSGPAPQAPPVRLQTTPTEVLIGWIPPPPQPLVAVNLRPPIAGPAPQAPPVRAQTVPAEILVGWIPPPPGALIAVNLNPPIAGPTPQPPPILTAAGNAALAAWAGTQPLPQQGTLVAAIAGSVAPQQLPSPMRLQAYTWAIDWPPQPRQYLIQSGPTPTNPPVNGGAAVSQAVLVAWLPQPPQAPITARSIPPTSAAPQGLLPRSQPGMVEIQASWMPSIWPRPRQLTLTASGPTPTAPPARVGSVPREVLIGWLPPPPLPAIPAKFTASGAPATPSWLGNIWWITTTGNPGDRAWVSIGLGPNPTYQARLRSLYLVLSGSSAGLATMVVRDGPTQMGTIIFEADLYTAANSWGFLEFSEIDLRATAGNVLTVEFIAGTPGDVQEINAGGDYVAPGTFYGV